MKLYVHTLNVLFILTVHLKLCARVSASYFALYTPKINSSKHSNGPSTKC